jgi:hypothetical protein
MLLADVLARQVTHTGTAAFYSETSRIRGTISLSFCRLYRGNKYLQFDPGNAIVSGMVFVVRPVVVHLPIPNPVICATQASVRPHNQLCGNTDSARNSYVSCIFFD